MLKADDFSIFFKEIYGYEPFSWQQRLLEDLEKNDGKWPSVLDLPTGSGKTATIDIAVFHLAMQAGRGNARNAPVRIAFVVDRRLVVDDAFERAKNLEKTLGSPKSEMVARVAGCLKELADEGPPLVAQRLRGGVPRERDWARTPTQPVVLCSTVDQVGSRLLFRGYGVSDRMKSVHAGLIGSDCLILLDEAHLAEPFKQTLGLVDRYRGKNWRIEQWAAPWQFAQLTATPDTKSEHTTEEPFALDGKDRANPTLHARLQASKPAYLIAPVKSKKDADSAANSDDEDDDGSSDRDGHRRVPAIVAQVHEALKHFAKEGNGAQRPAIGVVLNRVARARAVFDQLRKQFPKPEGGELDVSSPDIDLMIGPARPVDREGLADKLRPIRTTVWSEGERRLLDRPYIIVATQCIEAGVDIDLDALITEAAPLDSLRQRFGRVNRAGRDLKPYAAIVADKSDLSSRADDPVYGRAIRATWDYLTGIATKEKGALSVDFGINAMELYLAAVSSQDMAGMTTKKPDAPVLLPAHLDLLSQTSPIPAADPDVGLYLHGPSGQPDAVTVIWRADVDAATKVEEEETRRLLMVVPPRSGEAIELPVWTVRRWLEGRRRSAANVADVPSREIDDEEGRSAQRVFRWKGDDEGSMWISPSAIEPGDTVIVPARYGGVDEYGWNPESEAPATDVALAAAWPFAQKQFAVRIAPGLLDERTSDELAAALATVRGDGAEIVRQALIEMALPQAIKDALIGLGRAKKRKIKADERSKRRSPLAADFSFYGDTDKDEPRGVVLIAPFGITPAEEETIPNNGDGSPNATEDDIAGSVIGVPLSLKEHTDDVVRMVEAFVRSAGLSQAYKDALRLAALLHDEGKRDRRFQAWLQFGDPLGFDSREREEDVLAKSGRWLPPVAREKSGLPPHWRHEALSVRLAPDHPEFKQAGETGVDPDLVLWLIGTHHGHGRPLFPHRDPEEKVQPFGPQSLAFDWNGLDWPSLFAVLKERYGVWELARLEAILRLADGRASEEERARAIDEAAE